MTDNTKNNIHDAVLAVGVIGGVLWGIYLFFQMLAFIFRFSWGAADAYLYETGKRAKPWPKPGEPIQWTGWGQDTQPQEYKHQAEYTITGKLLYRQSGPMNAILKTSEKGT
jgi:hypothetical protein